MHEGANTRMINFVLRCVVPTLKWVPTNITIHCLLTKKYNRLSSQYISLKAYSLKVSVSLNPNTKFTQINFVCRLYYATKYIFKHGSLRSLKGCNEAWLPRKLVFLDKQMTSKRLKEHPKLIYKFHSILFSPILQLFLLFALISTSFDFLPFFFSLFLFFFLFSMLGEKKILTFDNILSYLIFFFPFCDYI